MQAGGPAPILRDAAFEFVHRFDGPVLYQIIDIPAQQRVGVQRILHRGQQVEVLFGVEIAAGEGVLHGLNAGVGERDIPPVLIHREMEVAPKVARHAVHAMSQRFFIRFAARDHQGDARLVDEDRIGFIDYSGREWPMHLVLGEKSKLIAKIIEANLIRRGVGDVAGIGALAILHAHALLDATHGESHEFVDPAHPLGVAPGQIIVHGHHVDAWSVLRVPHDGGDSGQRFSFAGLHLGNSAIGQRQRPLQLHVKHLQAQHSGGSYGCDGDEFPQLLCAPACGPQIVIAEPGHFRAATVDCLDIGLGRASVGE